MPAAIGRSDRQSTTSSSLFRRGQHRRGGGILRLRGPCEGCVGFLALAKLDTGGHAKEARCLSLGSKLDLA
jgi:hypothetical protein